MTTILEECELPTQHICSSYLRLVLIPAQWVQVILGTGVDDFLLFLVQLFWNLRNKYNLIYIYNIYYIFTHIYIYIYIYWNYVCVCPCVHIYAMWVQCPKRSEEIVRSPRAGITGGYELCGVLGSELRSSARTAYTPKPWAISLPRHMCISPKVKERYIDNLHCH